MCVAACAILFSPFRPPPSLPFAGNTALHFVCDPLLQLHVDPEKKLATLLLSRGAQPAPMNNEFLLPHQGLSQSEAIASEERKFMGHAEQMRPSQTVEASRDQRARVLAAARYQLARGAPSPDPERYKPVPKEVPPWEREEALPPRSVRKGGGGGSSLLAARAAARGELKASL